MNVNHETTQLTMIGSGGVVVGGGFLTWLESSASLLTLVFLGVATIVTLLTSVLNIRINLREEARKEEAHRKAMGYPPKPKGSDNEVS